MAKRGLKLSRSEYAGLIRKILGVLAALWAGAAYGAESFNPQARIFVGQKDVHLAALELSRWCLDNGIADDPKNASWEHRPTGESVFNCVRETEGDGNEGSPTKVTFTYHFTRTSKSTMQLKRITTSQGYTLSKPEMVNALPGRGK